MYNVHTNNNIQYNIIMYHCHGIIPITKLFYSARTVRQRCSYYGTGVLRRSPGLWSTAGNVALGPLNLIIVFVWGPSAAVATRHSHSSVYATTHTVSNAQQPQRGVILLWNQRPCFSSTICLFVLIMLIVFGHWQEIKSRAG